MNVDILITLLIYVLVLGIVWWVVQQIPLPDPMRLVVIVIFALIAIVLLLGLIGGSPLVFRR